MDRVTVLVKTRPLSEFLTGVGQVIVLRSVFVKLSCCSEMSGRRIRVSQLRSRLRKFTALVLGSISHRPGRTVAPRPCAKSVQASSCITSGGQASSLIFNRLQASPEPAQMQNVLNFPATPSLAPHQLIPHNRSLQAGPAGPLPFLQLGLTSVCSMTVHDDDLLVCVCVTTTY